jgi:hypothetical protein
MAEFGTANEHWVLPTIDAMGGGQVRCHVSIVLEGEDDTIAAEDVDLAIEAGGQWLAQTGRPDQLRYVTLTGTNAIAFFSFDNPSDAQPTRAVVTLRGEQAEFNYGTPGPLPVA